MHFTFTYCDGRPSVPGLNLEVFGMGAAGVSREECLMIEKNASDQPLPGWRLGEPLPGFRVQGCDKLATGEYRVSV